MDQQSEELTYGTPPAEEGLWWTTTLFDQDGRQVQGLCGGQQPSCRLPSS